MTKTPSAAAGPKTVAVFGAGIAGMSAAHELVERGFHVEVYEPEEPSPVERLAGASCGIGGMAHTHWTRAERPENRSLPEPHNRTSADLVSTEEIVLLPQVISFGRSIRIKNQAQAQKLDEVAAVLNEHTEIENVEVRGFCRERYEPYPATAARRARIDYRRAQAVVAALVKRGVKRGRLKAAALGLGHPERWNLDDAARDFVSFRVIEDWVPGEHGFRFFPSFYRNLFDTMRRTPIARAEDVYIETPRSVLDNIIPTEIQGFYFNNPKKSFTFPRRPPTSLREFFDSMEAILTSMGFDLRDVALYLLALFKYMTSCPERRAAEYEDVSWWDFVGGDRFSEAFQKLLDATPQTLVAMTSKQADARTFGTITVQMFLDQYATGGKIDGTLNGPTGLAWFSHWRRYLETQGVEFYRGRLAGFEVFDASTIWPKVALRLHECAGKKEKEEEIRAVLVRDYYVVAIPPHELQKIVKKNPQLTGGDFDKIRTLDLGDPTKAEPGGETAHMSGIQYFFDTDFGSIRGHTAYADAEWGLSSISQPQFWTRRRGWWDGYRGVLSVDICNWHEPGKRTGRSAWKSTRDEIAGEIWGQIKATIDDPSTLPEPILYHLDEDIEFGAGGLPEDNEAPFLINRAGTYRRRPGHPGGYAVHFGNLVFAGAYMQTHTRMMTMESANESARNAVNAILDADAFRGMRCEIANPEDHEPADLQNFIELDRELHRHGLPHFADILDLSAVPKDVLGPCESPGNPGGPRAGEEPAAQPRPSASKRAAASREGRHHAKKRIKKRE